MGMGIDSLTARVRSLVRRTFGNHETLEEENDWPSPTNPNAQEPSGSRSVSTDYTELMGGSVPCPSCKGTGRIPREMEETLVALIPLNDDRLKPKRTWLYVLVGIGACAMIAAVAIFMLVPRAVELIGNTHSVNKVYVFNADNKTMDFHFMNYVTISNWNYYSVQVLNTSALITNRFNTWTADKIGTGTNATVITVAPLSNNNNNLYFNSTVRITEGVAEYCQASFSRITSLFVSMQFDITVQIMYFNHRETVGIPIDLYNLQVSISNIQQVCCIPSGNCTST